MNFLATAAIIAIAGLGLMSQDQAQTPAQRFLSAMPELEKYFTAAQYTDAIKLLEDLTPSEAPEVKKDPQDPNVLLRSLFELGIYQDMNAYMGRALVMAGKIEQSISSFQKAKDIAELKAKETEGFVNLQIQGWEAAIEHAKTRLQEIETLMKTKEELEAKTKKTSNEKKQLEALKQNTLALEYETNTHKDNISRGPAAIAQMKNALEKEKEDSARFAPVIASLEEALKSERETISSTFGGDKAKYVASVIDTKANLEEQPTKDDKIKLLNRLAFLDPNNKIVQQQLALLIGKS